MPTYQEFHKIQQSIKTSTWSWNHVYLNHMLTNHNKQSKYVYLIVHHAYWFRQTHRFICNQKQRIEQSKFTKNISKQITLKSQFKIVNHLTIKIKIILVKKTWKLLFTINLFPNNQPYPTLTPLVGWVAYGNFKWKLSSIKLKIFMAIIKK